MWLPEEESGPISLAERPPALAGRFYAADAAELRADIQSRLSVGPTEAWRAPVAIAPYATHSLVGPLLGKLYGAIEVPDIVVMLTGADEGGERSMQIESFGTWRIPGLRIPIAEQCAQSLRDLALLSETPGAFRHDVAIETQLPFLSIRNPRVRIVPVRLSGLPWTSCRRVAQALADLVSQHRRRLLVLGLSNLSRGADSKAVSAADARVCEHLAHLDADQLFEEGTRGQLTVGALMPLVVSLLCARFLDAEASYQHGHRISTADGTQSVGYATFSFRTLETQRLSLNELAES